MGKGEEVMSYIKKKSAKQEKRTSKEFGGIVTPASGAMWSAKGDVRTDNYLIENKYTDSDSYKLELKILDKIGMEALKDDFRVPVLQIDIQELHLVVLNYNDYQALFETDEIHSEEICTNKSLTLHKDDLYLLIDEFNGLKHLVKFQGKPFVIMLKSDFLFETN